MKSRKHLKTLLFVAAMLMVGTTMGTVLLIERQGGGSQVSGKSDQAGGAGRPTHAPMATAGILHGTPAKPEDAVPGSNPRWSPPPFVSWPQGATGGGATYESGVTYEWPEYYGSRTREAGYGGATYTIVGAGPDNTAVGRVGFNRGTESAPSVGSLFNAVSASSSPASLNSASLNSASLSSASLSPAPANSPEVSARALVTPPVPEPAEWTMLVAGLLFIGVLAHRRKRQASAH